MKLILDASIAVKWVLPEADAPRALALREEFRNQIHELIAPDIFAVEVAHALTRAERRGILQRPEASIKLIDVLVTAPDFYDCLYLALAEREQCEVLTADRRLGSMGLASVMLLANLP